MGSERGALFGATVLAVLEGEAMMGFGFSARARMRRSECGGDCLPRRRRSFSLIHLSMSFGRVCVCAVFVLFALVAFGQGEALRTPRPDVSLGGAPRVGCVFYPPGAEVRVTNFPGQGVDFEVWEDLGEATFLAWVRLANAQVGLFPLYVFTAEPIVRERAPARVFFASGAWRGPMVFGGEVEASAVGTNGVGKVGFDLVCDGEVSVDFGAGATALGAGEHRGVMADGVPGADVSVACGTNVSWRLVAAVPRERRRFSGGFLGWGFYREGLRPGSWHALVGVLGVGTNGVARLERLDLWPNGERQEGVSEVDLGGALALPGPSRLHPFMGCTMYAAMTNFVVDVSQPVTQWVWGRKFWRRRLSAGEIEAVVAADARELARMGELTEADFAAPSTNAAPARLRARGAGVGGLPAPVPLDAGALRALGLPEAVR